MKNQEREEKVNREQLHSEKEEWGGETLKMEELASFVRFAMPSKLDGGRLHIYTIQFWHGPYGTFPSQPRRGNDKQARWEFNLALQRHISDGLRL